MSVSLKKLLGDGGAGFDKSHGTDRLYELLEALIGGLLDVTNVIVDGLIVTTPSTSSTQITGNGATTWNVNVGAGRARVNDVEDDIAAAADTAIHDTTELLDAGQSCYAWLVITESAGTLSITAVKGTPATTGLQVAPTDDEITASVGSANWAKIALCLINRTGDTTVTQSEDNTGRTLLRNNVLGAVTIES